MEGFFHKSIMLDECMDGLNIRPDGIYVDGTLGGGGHSEAIASRLTTGRLIGIDRDEEAINAAGKRLAPYGDRFTAVRGNFSDIRAILTELGISAVNGVMFDFGVSSPQLDDAERGFSYMKDAPLDMRMDRSQAVSAREIVNEWPRDELKRILFLYGEEKCAGLIAAAIERERSKEPIETTLRLAEIVRSAMPARARREEQHPAKRTFQAIRIAVNDELTAIERVIPDAAEMLAPGGRIAAISFHSLEDRIVKTSFQTLAKGCTCPPDFPVCVCGKKPSLRIITKKPVEAGNAELEENPRARSARLRIAEKI